MAADCLTRLRHNVGPFAIRWNYIKANILPVPGGGGR